MDEQLHGLPPKPLEIGNLDTPYSSEYISSAFIFEPEDLVPFHTAWNWQKSWQKKLFENIEEPQAVWILQHPSCYTLGKGGSNSNVLFDSRNNPLFIDHVDRGGEVTHHLPGQLVVYFVLDLHRYKTDLHWYLRELEQVVIDLLQELGLCGKRVEGLTGVWCGSHKVCSIGVGCRRWITQHGLSLNIDCDLKGFSEIVPCGLHGHKIGRLCNWLPGIRVSDVQPIMKRLVLERFRLRLKK